MSTAAASSSKSVALPWAASSARRAARSRCQASRAMSLVGASAGLAALGTQTTSATMCQEKQSAPSCLRWRFKARLLDRPFRAAPTTTRESTRIIKRPGP